ncbi:MAG: type II secretion system secretin GspD [Candidatus Omnitrophica bacterium]|nr:type II secretion system secretin GspD [Candidatus Omnitrophota bacterium]
MLKGYFKRMKVIVGLVLSAALIVSCFAGGLSAETKDKDTLISFNFKETDIESVLQFFSEITGLTIIKGDKVRGKVTVIGAAKLPVDEALDVLQAILEVKGFTMVRSGKVMKVVSQAEAIKKSVETRIGRGPESGTSEDKVVTQIIPLKYIAASDMKGVLGGLIFSGGNIIASERTNTLVITDVASNIKRLVKIIDQLDVEIGEENIRIEIIPLEYADEVELSSILTQVYSSGTKKKLSPSGKKRIAGISKDFLGGIVGEVAIIPDERLHSLIIITAKSNFKVIKGFIGQLDRESPASADNIRVFPLQNGKAEEVAAVLNELFAGIASGQKGVKARRVPKPGEPIRPASETGETLPKEGFGTLEGAVKVVADKRTNALIITTFPQNFSTIKRLIDQLDVRSPQVLIKALIAEVTLSNETKFGIEWEYAEPWSGGGHKVAGTASGVWGLSDFISEGFKYSVLRDDENLSGLIQALAKESEFNILSAPCILASDNQEARFKVGESVPILKDVSYTEASGTVKSYDYKDVAIELTVTSTVNKNRDVCLKVHQLINKISAYDPELNAPILITREAETTVVIKDGQTIVIGGLMRDDKTKSVSKIPILGDIPILGLLFRKHHDTVKKTELLVFITPHVIINPEDAKEMTQREINASKSIRLPLEFEQEPPMDREE